ncbi:GIY-YIG nuclease family protein [Aeromicrobium sp. CFBP 8757]|uniref:GIY-YIG nuclease family protein n=1 Tax=Aeromicrobium sp. CFBP 8757 TaxID=2775288 RepID=UPI0017823858|nr:GIY-YIG nuclease family protein [Aeromicrobium sp. CFBP 8757]MBD8608865.1 GIY-YIG nuclease family protein [Aeromicrobium sp. CFBP 8757]
MPFTYVLLCADNTYYTGSTWDLLTRLRQHRSGEGAAYTSRRLPVRLVYYEEYERINEAFYREKKIHGWTHGKKRMLVRDGPGVRVDGDTHLFGSA